VGYLENLWNALDFGSLRDMVLRLVSVFLCLTVHETCHGLAALALAVPASMALAAEMDFPVLDFLTAATT
jgi:hypothetical protein